MTMMHFMTDSLTFWTPLLQLSASLRPLPCPSTVASMLLPVVFKLVLCSAWNTILHMSALLTLHGLLHVVLSWLHSKKKLSLIPAPSPEAPGRVVKVHLAEDSQVWQQIDPHSISWPLFIISQRIP